MEEAKERQRPGEEGVTVGKGREEKGGKSRELVRWRTVMAS